jgi:hypothetical protein
MNLKWRKFKWQKVVEATRLYLNQEHQRKPDKGDQHVLYSVQPLVMDVKRNTEDKVEVNNIDKAGD